MRALPFYCRTWYSPSSQEFELQLVRWSRMFSWECGPVMKRRRYRISGFNFSIGNTCKINIIYSFRLNIFLTNSCYLNLFEKLESVLIHPRNQKCLL